MQKPLKTESGEDLVIIGRLGAPNGVRGWLRVQSFTEPLENIINFSSWHIQLKNGWELKQVNDIKSHGKGFIVKLDGIDDRDQAATYTNFMVAVLSNELPSLEEGYYWKDLIGLDVFDKSNHNFGKVIEIMETGSNDVIVVKGDKEHLIPYIDDFVLEVNLTENKIIVDWDKDF